MSDAFFYLFSALILGGALGVALNRNTVHASFSLLISLLGTAGLFVLLDAYLLAVLMVLVYAGAVVALFVFIVMLIGMKGGPAKPLGKLSIVASVIGGLLLVSGIIATFGGKVIPSPAKVEALGGGAQLKLYSSRLFTTYLLPVQISGFLLLVAMIGVIVISKRPKGEETSS